MTANNVKEPAPKQLATAIVPRTNPTLQVLMRGGGGEPEDARWFLPIYRAVAVKRDPMNWPYCQWREWCGEWLLFGLVAGKAAA